MGIVCCFGELLLRMSPVLNGQWINENKMPVYIGGAELNVATALSCWGIPTKYMSALPKNYLSAEIVKGFSTITCLPAFKAFLAYS